MTTARTAIALSVAAQATSVLPLVLLGTMGVGIRRDLGFDEGALGALIAVSFATAAVLSLVSGRVVDAVGGHAGVRAAALTGGAGLALLATLATSWRTAVGPVVLIGAGIALVQPATDALVTAHVPLGRHGMAFALKQTAGGPAIGLVAGLAVPLVATTLGWRTGFGAAAAASVVVAALAGAGRARRPTRAPVHNGPPPARGIRTLAVAGCIGTVAQSAFVAFAVSSAVDAGLSEGSGGVLFAAGSVLGAAVRVAGGHLADRRTGGLLVAISSMLLLSVVGFLLLATEQQAAVSVAVPLLCATAWGWPGLYFLAIARTSGGSARASAAAAAGVLSGGVVGPLVLGSLVRASYSTAWTAGALCSMASAGLFLLGRRWLLAERDALALA